MNEEVFVYKCPSCGGKVNYIDNKWHCEYCGNVYNALFPIGNKELPKIDNKRYTMYHYKCNNCNNTFVSLQDKNATCNFCNEISSDEGKKFVASNIIETNISLEVAKKRYYDDIEKYSKYIDKKFLDVNLNGEYLYSDLYNGCVKLKYNNNIEKYLFVNLLVPNIKNDDYKFMYDLGNIGISHSREMSAFNDIQKEIINNGNYINDVESINYENDIVDECIKIFAKKYNIKNLDKIQIEKSLEVSEGVFIPVYKNTISIGDKQFYQYVMGNDSIKILRKTPSFRNICERTMFCFPSKNNAFKKYKSCHRWRMIFSYIAASFIPYLFIILFTRSTYDLARNFNVFMVINAIVFGLTIISMCLAKHLFKKETIYYNSIKLTKEKYLQQIISNSNYVKIIKVKK